MKPEYGPSLARALAPRWHEASRAARAGVLLVLVGLVAILVGIALTFVNSSYSRGGAVPFSFNYRDLYRTRPDPGGYAKVDSRWPDGALKYSFAVQPLRLPAYSGEQSVALTLYATGYIEQLRRTLPGFQLRGEGKSKLNKQLVGYAVLYSAYVEGRRMFGRNVLLLPPRAGARDGVDIVMLTAPGASTQVTSPLEVGSTGVLNPPLKTFAFG